MINQCINKENIFCFNFEELSTQVLKSQASLNSLNQGRRLYFCESSPTSFWLKTQLKYSNQIYEQGFVNELKCYEYIKQHVDRIILPFQILELTPDSISDALGYPCLITQHAQSLFLNSASTMSIDQIQNTLLQALDTLDQFHKLELIHGDLKKQHVVWHEKQAKLIDFEQSIPIIKINKNNITQHTATPRYMAPELFHAQSKSVASDIYALGIIFYEWLTECRLQAKTYHDWAVLHCQTLVVQLPKRFFKFEMLLNAMLQKQKDHRETHIPYLKMCLIH